MLDYQLPQLIAGLKPLTWHRIHSNLFLNEEEAFEYLNGFEFH